VLERRIEFLLLGSLEVRERGRPVVIERPLARALLVYLLLHANQQVSAERLLQELWGHELPRTAAASLQNYVSRLRRKLGTDRLRLEPAGYVLQVRPDELDLVRFQQLVQEAERADEAKAVSMLSEAVSLWRGPPFPEFQEEPFEQARRRLEDLRLTALERRLELELGLGRQASVLAELKRLVHEHPLREKLYFLLMLALYRDGRQAEALAAFRAARATLQAELALEPAPRLRELERQILRQAPELELPPRPQPAARAILVAALDSRHLDQLLWLAEPLARRSGHELIVTLLAQDAAGIEQAAAALKACRALGRELGITVRTAALTTAAPAADLLHLAGEQNVELLLVDAASPETVDETVSALLESAPCDVALLACTSALPDQGPVLVPFGGAEHDWSAIEVAGWFAAASERPLVLAGPTAAADQRDASRLLATAALAVDRALGVAATPALVEPSAPGLLAASEKASLVVVGLPPRWRQRGLGEVRGALAARDAPPLLLVRQGLRPSGLAPAETLTQFTWSLAPPAARRGERPNL
jgi:DNA-binding SARP family transcriptional activator